MEKSIRTNSKGFLILAVKLRCLMGLLLLNPVFLHPIKGEQLHSLQNAWDREEYASARDIALDLAAKGDVTAHLILGLLYEYGLGGHRDSTAGTYWIQTAARGGLDVAHLALSDINSSKTSSDDHLSAFGYRYLQKQTHLKFKDFNLGTFTIGEINSREKNLLLALQYNRRIALDRKESWAMANTASLLEEPENLRNRNLFNLSRIYRAKALEAEDPSLLHQQALYQKLGLSKAPDSKSTRELFELSSSKGYRESKLELGKLLVKEKASTEDVLQGLQLIEESSQVDPSELQDFAELFHDGEVVEEDMVRALPLYSQAAEKGARHAASEAGRFHEFGWAGEKNFDAAEKFYRLAAARGSYWGSNHLGRFLLKTATNQEQADEGLRWLEHSAHQENISAAMRLAKLYGSGSKWVSRDTEKRLYWLKWAALYDDPEANYSLANHQFSNLDWRTDTSQFDLVWASLNKTLALENFDALGLMCIMLTRGNSPQFEPQTALKLLEAYFERYPRSLLLSAQIMMSEAEELNDPESAKELIGIYQAREGGRPPFESINLALLYPEVFEDPVAHLKREYHAIYVEDSSIPESLTNWQRLDGCENLEEVYEFFASRIISRFKSAEVDNPRFTINGRKLKSMVEPDLSNMLGLTVYQMLSTVAFYIKTDGKVFLARGIDGTHPFARFLMAEAVSRWRWEPDANKDADPLRVRLPLSFTAR